MHMKLLTKTLITETNYLDMKIDSMWQDVIQVITFALFLVPKRGFHLRNDIMSEYRVKCMKDVLGKQPWIQGPPGNNPQNNQGPKIFC